MYTRTHTPHAIVVILYVLATELKDAVTACRSVRKLTIVLIVPQINMIIPDL